jgi:acetyl-CoA acetyltransferase family protein
MTTECVFIDAVRTANARAHKEKGWFRKVRPDELLTAAYTALFSRNPRVKPEMVDAVFVGSSNPSGMQNEIGRLGWLASGLPETVPSQTICNQCPSGMSATMDAARAIMAGETEIMIAAGVDDMEKVAMGANIDFPPRLFARYNLMEVTMGATAEKVADQYDISVDDMNNFAIHSHECAKRARDAGKFKNEIVPVKGLAEDGSEFMVDRDQWIREKLDPAEMRAMKTPFKENGKITAAMSSPLTAGAAALLLMSREKADRLGLAYTHRYRCGVQTGNDPTVMGIGPIPAVRKLFEKTGLTPDAIGAVEINEAFASQALACIRELKLDRDNAPFAKVNTWGGAIALGHPLGESGARIIVTLLNRMKTDYPQERYGLATLCGGFGNANAVLIEKVDRS